MCNLIANPKESKDNTHVWEQSAKHNIWINGGENERRMKETRVMKIHSLHSYYGKQINRDEMSRAHTMQQE